MKEMIINLIKEKGPLSYGELLMLLQCENDELAKEIFEMEDLDVIKIGKLYNLIDGINYVRGTIVIRNDNPYLKVNNESIYVSKSYLGNAFDKDIVIATIHHDFYGRKEARIYKVVVHSNLEIDVDRAIVDIGDLSGIANTGTDAHRSNYKNIEINIGPIPVNIKSELKGVYFYLEYTNE